MKLTPEEQKKQEYYRDARTGGYYGKIWTTVGKCVFCDLRDKYIVHEENGIVLTVALFAYIDGNLMIVPRRHIKSVKELTESEWQTVRKFMYLAKKIIRKTHNLKDIQYVIRDGGAAVNSTVQDHLHIHCIPSDAPDLTVWNYRKLKFTPLENAELFRSQSAKITDLGQKFDAKYQQQNKIEVNCNLLIQNSRNEILFHERPSWAKIGDDWISPPGGMVKDFGRSLEEELAREVQEETGLRLDPASFELVSSSVEKLKRYRQSETANTGPSYMHQFLWNIYTLKDQKIKANAVLTPGDDAVKMIWVPLAEVPTHPRISPGVKRAIAKAAL